jgi:hypothetical protein
MTTTTATTTATAETRTLAAQTTETQTAPRPAEKYCSPLLYFSPMLLEQSPSAPVPNQTARPKNNAQPESSGRPRVEFIFD